MTELSNYFADLNHYPVMPWWVSVRHLNCIYRLRQELECKLVGSSEKQNGWRRQANLKTIIGIRKLVCEGNLRLVVACAKHFKTPYLLSECIAEGNIGLLAAIDGFDVHRRCRFSTYASYVINTHIHNLINSQSLVLSRSMNQRISSLMTAWRTLAAAGNTNPTDQEIVNWLNKNGAPSLRGAWKTKHILLLRANKKKQSHYSLDKPIRDNISFGDTIPAKGSSGGPINGTQLDVKIAWKCLERHADTRSVDVIRRRLNNEHLKDIGTIYNISRERVRQIETETLERVRKVFRCYRDSWMPLASLIESEERSMVRILIARWLSYREPPLIKPHRVNLPTAEYPENLPIPAKILTSNLPVSSFIPC